VKAKILALETIERRARRTPARRAPQALLGRKIKNQREIGAQIAQSDALQRVDEARIDRARPPW